jgi:glutathione S-transferase
MRLWTKLVDEWLHVDSRTVGQCVAMRFASLAADADVVARHYRDMPEEVRRENDLINNELGVDSPLLPGAIRRFKKLFHDIDDALGDAPWLAGETYSLADISMVVYANRLESFQMAPLWDGLARLKEWYARNRARPSYTVAIVDWGDTTSQKRVELGNQAFPKVKQLWDAA